jgi:hypothetical protein
MRKTAIARLADNLKDVPLLFPPLKDIAFEIASLCGFIYMKMQLWKHL